MYCQPLIGLILFKMDVRVEVICHLGDRRILFKGVVVMFSASLMGRILFKDVVMFSAYLMGRILFKGVGVMFSASLMGRILFKDK